MNQIVLCCFSAAIVIGSAFGEAAVYDFSLTVKTTKTASGTVKALQNMCGEEVGTIVYRKQASVKVQGLIWGCGCSALSEPLPFSDWYADGFAFWNTSTKESYLAESEFSWRMLNRIAITAKEVEGTWDMRLVNSFGEVAFDLVGAGFGTVVDTIISKDKKSGAIEIDFDQSYVKTISGSFAGTGIGPKDIKVTIIERECSYCQGGRERQEIVEENPSRVWSLCECDDAVDSLTAAHGTWTIKYNKSASKKLAKSDSILNAFSFPKYVKSTL